jgi:hypothetical protein
MERFYEQRWSLEAVTSKIFIKGKPSTAPLFGRLGQIITFLKRDT